jgi:hypothetical protein
MQENQADIKLSEKGSVLITGGSGLIGMHITSVLLSEGYKVSHLSRKANLFGKVRVFRWDPDKGILDPTVFEGVDCVIHLAGANIGEKRWTRKRKEEILTSRVNSARVLYKVISEKKICLKAYISASAVGYYGLVSSDKIFTEEEEPASDFLGSTCRHWEESADKFADLGIRNVKIRTAVVLEKNDSALSKLMRPAKLGVFPLLGSGRQYMPWIHIGDLCGIYLKAIQDDRMIGSFNAVSPLHITQREFMRTLAQVMNKPFFHPHVPAILLRMSLGEMADLVLKGSKVSSEKITNLDYRFQYTDLNVALKQIFNDIR